MFGQLFGKHLVKKGILTEGEYRDAVAEHLGRRVKIGTIAIAEGLLTQEQVIEIHRQQRQFDKLFGDIAIENGFLTQEQVDKMLAKQGICVRAGLHCAPSAHEQAGTLSTGSLRVSFSPFISSAQARTASHELKKFLKKA